MPDYGVIDDVKMMLRPNEATSYGADIDARLTLIQKAVSRRLEHELGWDRADTTVTLYTGGGSVLMLPTPARSITSVTVGGTVSGNVITGGTVSPASDWEHYPVDALGRILGLRLVSGWDWGVWSATGAPLTPVVIAGDFDVPNAGDDVPDDVTYAANLLILRTFQRENTGVAGVSGEDGSFQAPLNPWNDPMVTDLLKRYRVVQLASF